MTYTLRLTDGDVEAYIQRPSEIVKNILAFIFLQGITQANETKQVYFERLFRLLTLRLNWSPRKVCTELAAKLLN